MLGVVAFSQNPPTSKTLTKTIDYTVPPGLIVINPPTRATVKVSGLADTIGPLTSSSVVITADLTKASPGPSVKVNLSVRSLVLGVTIQDVPAVALDIDQRSTVALTVTVRTPSVAPGWQVTKAEARCPNSPCTVAFDGPAGMETNLKAYADFTDPVENSSYDVLTQPIVLEQNGAPLELSKLAAITVAPANLDINTVSIHIEAKTGTTSRQVSLIDAAPSNPPPNCYRVTGIALDPITVIITGSPEVLVKITTITLPAVDLTNVTSNTTFKVTVPYPDGVTGSAATARVTYSISPNPNCATPSP